MAANAKACPSCGARNKQPVYKKLWFWIFLILVAAAIGSAAGGGSDAPGQSASKQAEEQTGGVPEESVPAKETAPEIVYTAYTVGQLMDDLESNALRAKTTYQDQYVELTGSLNVIDNHGKYISIVPAERDFAIIGVHCTIQNDGQLDRVLEMNIGDSITVRGKITDVSEVLGYSLDIDHFGE